MKVTTYLLRRLGEIALFLAVSLGVFAAKKGLDLDTLGQDAIAMIYPVSLAAMMFGFPVASVGMWSALYKPYDSILGQITDSGISMLYIYIFLFFEAGAPIGLGGELDLSSPITAGLCAAVLMHVLLLTWTTFSMFRPRPRNAASSRPQQ